MSTDKDRIVFHSKEDLSSSHYLKKSVTILESFSDSKTNNVNDILELFHVKLYFDNELYLNEWSEATKERYLAIVDRFWKSIKEFTLGIDDDNILMFYNDLDFQYCSSFWKLISLFNIYKKISKDKFPLFIDSKKYSLRQILEYPNIVKYFSQEIKKVFLNNTNSAELILGHYEERRTQITRDLCFPNLSKIEYEQIFQNYLNSSEPNLNYVRLIVTAKAITISDKTKLNAKRLAQKLNDEALKDGVSWMHGIEVIISKEQTEPVLIKPSKEKNGLSYSYSETWLNSTMNPISILLNFSILFRYTNSQDCIELVARESEVEGLENIFMRSKNEYHVYAKFQHKNMLSQAQLYLYLHYLESHEIKIENVLSSVVNDFVNHNYGIEGIKLNSLSENISDLEKIRTLAPEMDFLLKQYKAFAEEGTIDFELLQFSSAPLNFSQIKSRAEKKYVYGQGDEFLRLKHSFFSSASSLHYVEPYKSKYRNLYQLLENENVPLELFKGYQKYHIEPLIEDDYLYENEQGFLKIRNKALFFVIGNLHFTEVISFWHQSKNVRDEIHRLEEKGIIRFENTLFTISERQYFNYFLNQKEFTNGLDLRNKYMHGTNTNSAGKQKDDYISLLKILILIILKILDDLEIEKAINEENI
ncbi:MAG: hypothetical protein ACJAWV_001374 [Flammeovirgaceae bacterium]|jgi:hypothetical protein